MIDLVTPAESERVNFNFTHVSSADPREIVHKEVEEEWETISRNGGHPGHGTAANLENFFKIKLGHARPSGSALAN